VTTDLFTPRPGRPAPDGPYERVPPHLRHQLIGWLLDVYSIMPADAISPRIDVAGLELVAAWLRIDLNGPDADGPFPAVIGWASVDDERFLDLLHYTLKFRSNARRLWKKLDLLLAIGRSVWRATEKGLVLRQDPTATAAFEKAREPKDVASAELSEAWSKAYGRDLDASDAWDHAIKAVEAILRGIVSPNNTQATLGTLIRDLRDGSHKFDFVLTNDSGGVQPSSRCCS
jgi:hypothetical protein